MRIHQGDITKLQVDAIVNAANPTLLGGGGVDGAIHRAAGLKLKIACAKLFGCATGNAKWTEGFALPAKVVIHTVGPVFQDDESSSPLLRSCYRKSLEIATELKLKTIAFPGISTGVYGYPAELAAGHAVDEVKAFLAQAEGPLEVTFCCFSDRDREIYQGLLPEAELSAD